MRKHQPMPLLVSGIVIAYVLLASISGVIAYSVYHHYGVFLAYDLFLLCLVGPLITMAIPFGVLYGIDWVLSKATRRK